MTLINEEQTETWRQREGHPGAQYVIITSRASLIYHTRLVPALDAPCAERSQAFGLLHEVTVLSGSSWRETSTVNVRKVCPQEAW